MEYSLWNEIIKELEKNVGKTIQSFHYPDQDGDFDFVEIIFTDNTSLEVFSLDENEIGISNRRIIR